VGEDRYKKRCPHDPVGVPVGLDVYIFPGDDDQVAGVPDGHPEHGRLRVWRQQEIVHPLKVSHLGRQREEGSHGCDYPDKNNS